MPGRRQESRRRPRRSTAARTVAGHARVTVGRRIDGGLDRRHLSRKTKRDLDNAVRELEQARDAGRKTWLEGSLTLGAWLEHWLTTILPLSVRWKTLSTYQSLMRVHVMPAMGPARLTDLRPEVLERLYGRLLDEGKSAHVVHAVHRVLRSALGEAVRRHHLSQNPASVARPPRVVVPEIEPLTSEECRAVLQAAVDLGQGVIRIRRAVQRRTWQHGCIPKVGGNASCERARGGDCPKRKSGGLLLVELKTRASRRTIVLPNPLMSELSAHHADQLQHKAQKGGVWDDSLNLVFPDDVGGLIDPARDFKAWKKLLDRAGVREVRLHDARHTAATLLLVQGVDLRTVMSIMGWTEMATAQRYMHAVDDLRRRAALRMSEALWTTGQEQ